MLFSDHEFTDGSIVCDVPGYKKGKKFVPPPWVKAGAHESYVLSKKAFVTIKQVALVCGRLF